MKPYVFLSVTLFIILCETLCNNVLKNYTELYKVKTDLPAGKAGNHRAF